MIISQGIHKKQLERAARIEKLITNDVVLGGGEFTVDYDKNRIEIKITLPDFICESGICGHCSYKAACDEATDWDAFWDEASSNK